MRRWLIAMDQWVAREPYELINFYKVLAVYVLPPVVLAIVLAVGVSLAIGWWWR